jgi:hypothetical protein
LKLKCDDDDEPLSKYAFNFILRHYTKALLKQAIAGAAKVWGERSLSAFEAEDRLSFACEKAPTEDPAIVGPRAAFLAVEAEFKVGRSGFRD